MNRFQSHFDQRPNLTGTLLVASPRLSNTPMAESMVLVVQDSEEGVFGVRINEAASAEQAVAFEKASHLFSDRDSLMIGGPLDGPVIALHMNESLGEVQLQDGVYLSCSQNVIQMLVEEEPEGIEFEETTYLSNDVDFEEATEGASTGTNRFDFDMTPGSPYRIVLGVGGWQNNRIHAEINAGLWYPIQCDPEIVFEDTSVMWMLGLRRYGDNVAEDVTGVSPHGVPCHLN